MIDSLQASPYLKQNIFIHGLKANVKGKTLKRKTTVVKHSRFLRNLEVVPIFPEPGVVEEGNLEGEENNAEQEEDEE